MKTFLKLFFLLTPVFSFAQTIEANLLNNWDDEDIIPAFFDNPYHDVWGTVVDGTEYGVISATDGFYFFNVSGDGNNMEPAAFVEGTAQGSNISHRDIKTYQNYLYAVADEGPSALQVFDMSVLPDEPTMVYESNEHVARCHNMYIDEDNAHLYLVGGNGFTLKVLSLENPEEPTLLASFPNSQLNIPYIHDLYVRDNIGYLNAANVGLIVVDFNDPNNAVVLGTLTNYVQQGYNHSGWLSDDGNYYYMCDETHGTDIKIVDVQDFTDMSVVSTMNAGSTENQIVHNVYLQGNLLFTSYYYDGLQVFDVTNPRFPRRVAEYDTSTEPNISYFAGAWGVFVLPSGRALISDMQNGFYLFETLNLPDNKFLTPAIPQLEICPEQELSFDVWLGPDFDGEEITLSAENSDPELEVSLSATAVAPGDELTITVISATAGEFNIVVTATDGNEETETVLPINITQLPPAITLMAPTDERQNVDLTPLFFWSGLDQNAISNLLEISTSEDNFEDNIIFSQMVNGSSLILSSDLEEGTTYFWRIVSTYTCGDNPSTVFSFTTEMVTAVTDLEGNSFTLAPNPTSDFILLNFAQILDKEVNIELRSLSGQKIKVAQMVTGTNNLKIEVGELPKGVYLLQLASDTAVASRKIVVQ